MRVVIYNLVLPRGVIVTIEIKKSVSLVKLLYTSYVSPSNQAEKGRVFSLVDKCFETGGDLRNFCDKQNLKMWTPCFVGILLLNLARDFRVES